MSNPRQALIEEKVAELRQNHCHSKVDPLKNKHFFLKSASAHNTKLLFADIEQTIQTTIDTVSMIVREEEAVEYNKIIEREVAAERQFIINILDGIDIADEEMGNNGGGTKAIRFALKSRIITPPPDKD